MLHSTTHTPHSALRAPHFLRGAMLLEVILSLAILFVSMSVIGIQIRTALKSAYEAEEISQAIMLAEAKMAQLDTGVIQIERELDGDFGKSFPGYFWRFEFEPHDDIADMFLVKLEILYAPPEFDLEPGDIDDAEVVSTVHTFRPLPPMLNLQRDFGFTDEQMEEVATLLPPDVLDPSEISPAMFAEMDLEELVELLPLLIEVFGQGFGFSQNQIQQAIDSGLLSPSGLPTGAINSNPGSRRGQLPTGEEDEQ